MIVGTVAELWRYPVKSMQGERCSSLPLEAGGDRPGFEGDRAWAVVDPTTGTALSAKVVPPLLDAAAWHDGGRTMIRLPDGTELACDDAATSDALSRWLGRDVVLLARSAEVRSGFEMTFDPPDDDAEAFTLESPAGSFFDLGGVHALTTGSLATMAAARAATAWDVRRFRPNVLVRTPDGAGAYPEDAWVGGRVGLGPAAIDVQLRTLRCSMPLRAQPGLDRDVEVFRTMTAEHENHLGVYADPAVSGVVAEGDPVELVERVGGTDPS